MKICKLSIRFQSLAVAAAILATPVSADGFLDRLYLDGEQGSMNSGSVRSTEFNSPRSRLTGQSDTANPYLGKVEHRVFDSGFSPQRDQTLFVERIQDGVSKFRSGGVTEYSNDYNMFKAITSYLRSADGYEDGGKPVIAMFTKSRQVFLIYRVYEARDGRATLLCYYNSDGRVGSPGRLFEEKTFTLNGYKLRNGYRITEGSANDRGLEIGLIDPARKLEAETPMDYISDGGMGVFEDTSPIVGQDDWETNPPHPDNYQYGEGQVETKAKSTGDLLSGIMEPVLFGAKIGMGAYMLKEMFKKDDDDDDEDEWGNGYGYGMGYGYDSGYGMGYGSGYGMQYGNGAIMGGGMMGGGMPGMYPGMYPGMSYPMNGMTYQQPYFPGSYPGTMPGGSYPGSAPMPGYDYSTQMPGAYPGSTPSNGYGYNTGYPTTGYPTTGYPTTGGYTNTPPQVSYPTTGGYTNYDPSVIAPYSPAGQTATGTSNTAPLAPSSSTGSGTGMQQVIFQNDNPYLSTSGY